MIKVIVGALLASLSFLAFGAVPETQLHINETNFKRYINHEKVELDEKIIVRVDESILAGQSASVEVQWAGCKAQGGSSGFDVQLIGLRDLPEVHDSYQLKPGEAQFQTSAWITITRKRSEEIISKRQVYECNLLGTEYYPVSIKDKLIAKLIVTIEVPRPSCSITVPATIKVPAVSRKNPQSRVALPVELTCERADQFQFIPDVSLTLTSDAHDAHGHLLEDDNLTLQMLYGSDVPAQEGNEWLADGEQKYPAGKINGESKTVTPVIKATIKEGAAPEVRKVNATLTMNFS
ncbi:hypothetical protein J2125_000561 [Erwinia toletana]|uniref:Uncharacterized protein n=1 Tax=Winslowiella toletana TaxID=92490 RepID=A0ABS4P3Z7_9GAMM|nr:hypothetical protein [Winslowiella toletana]MBP2167369.1 hypothetical protein [Winslowiella toletana]